MQKPLLWTEHINAKHLGQMDDIMAHLCAAFNASPYFANSHMKMRVVDGQIEGYMEMCPELIGNSTFQILHGGATATMLDSIGGITAMVELYRHATESHFSDTANKVSRLATLDLRVDYIAPGRGKYFVARAEVLRLGRKSCLVRMNLHNDEQKWIATATATYSY